VCKELLPAASLNSSSASLIASDDNDEIDIENGNIEINNDDESMSSHECSRNNTNDNNNNEIINLNSSSQSHYVTAAQKPSSIIGLKDYYLNALERHKSIDNCFLPPVASIERIYLFDEIKKLTNHLFKITTNHYSEKTTPEYVTTTTTTTTHDKSMNSNGNLCMTANVNVGTVDDDDDKIDDLIEKTMPAKTKTLMEEQQHDGKNATNANNNMRGSDNNNPFSDIFKKFTQLADSGSVVNNNNLSHGVPWAVTKRTKFRINQTTSRDVPIVKTQAKLKKQNAIDATDTKIFDEFVKSKPLSVDKMNDSIVDILGENFSHKSHNMFHTSHIMRQQHDTMFVSRCLPNGSISFDCGELDVEQRSINTIRALFQLHAKNGTSVKQMQAQIESKNQL
jgi:hypothetical protein